ncbi:MAG: mannose-6-phosphate isomerase, class I [Chloroflexi bacterium]|nr:mannose-6-phosphate isomerase, class I [Chloroflexota bacterium]
MTHSISAILVKPRPYLMRNQIQHYAWGTRNDEAFIPRLLGIEPQPDTPYAELWMGTHSKAPSAVVVEGTAIPLDQWIAAHPLELLGAVVAERFSDKLPFLFKVLSIQEALSIQAHPNKTQAEILHARDPEHYLDDNHKPELAVALDSLTALVGIRPFAEILDALKRYPELADFVGQEIYQRLTAAKNPPYPEQQTLVRAMFATLIEHSVNRVEELSQSIDFLAGRLTESAGELQEEEHLFLDLRQRYAGADVGLFAIFLLNLVHLKAGEGVYTPAGIPHAYLKGNIVECMANSDNVVRVGLTPKFKDAQALVDILDCQPGIVSFVKIDLDSPDRVYQTPFDEFEVSRWQIKPGEEKSVIGSGPRVLIVIRGDVLIRWSDDQESGEEMLRRGQSVFIPALLKEFKIKASSPVELLITKTPYA